MMEQSMIQLLGLIIIVVYLQLSSGTTSNFPAYAANLKTSLNISQKQLNLLFSASQLGKACVIVPGFAINYLPIHIFMLIACLLGFFGFGVQFLFAANFINPPGSDHCYWLILFTLMFVAGNSASWFNIVCYKTISRHFKPLPACVVMGLLMCFHSLSTLVYADLVGACLTFMPAAAQHDQAYLFFDAVLPLLTTLLVIRLFPVINEPAEEVEIDFRSSVFRALLCTDILLCVYAVAMSGVFPRIQIIKPILDVVLMGIVVLAEIILVWILQRSRGQHNREMTQLEQIEEARQDSPHSQAPPVNDNDDPIGSPPNQESKKMSLNFFLFFSACLCTAPFSVFSNDLQQIAKSRGHDDMPYLVATAAWANFFGRIVPSLIYRRTYVALRPLSIAVLMIFLAVAFLSLMINEVIVLVICTVLIRMCCGAFTTVSVSVTRLIFGTKNFIVNHSILAAAVPIGSMLFRFMMTHLYGGGAEDEGICTTEDCFKTAFAIWGAICAMGAALGYTLHIRCLAA